MEKTAMAKALEDLIEYWKKESESADSIAKDHEEMAIIGRAEASRLRRCVIDAKNLLLSPPKTRVK